MSKPAPTKDDLKAWMWSQGVLEWKLWPQQLQIYQTIRSLPDDIQTVVVMCARQFGKSFLGVLMAVEDCLRFPGYTIPIVGPTIKQTTDIVYQQMRILEEGAPYGLIRRSKAETRWYIGESELIIGGFDSRIATRQRGKRALKIYIEETVDSNPDQYIDSIRSDLGPMLTHSPHPQIIYFTTPPRIPDHPFLTETVPEAKLHGAFFKYTINDNKQLSEKQFDACVTRSGGKHSIEFRREYLCEVVRDTTVVVVPDFNKAVHVRECHVPPRAKMQVTIDWGGSRDMTVALLHCYDFLDDKDIFIDERVFPPNTSTNKIMKAIRDMEKDHEIVQRSADVPGQIKVDLLKIHKYEIVIPPKDDWRAGVNMMGMMFTMNKIAIDPRCKFLVQSCESGTFNNNKTDFERTSILGHCDGLAALMYAVRTQNRENPYPKAYSDRFTSLQDGQEWHEDELSAVLQPVSFANSFESNYFKAKRFGSFNK